MLASRGEGLCVRFFRRADGTVMTSDCPDGARRKRQRRIAIATGALLAAGLAAGVAVHVASEEEPQPQQIMGGLS